MCLGSQHLLRASLCESWLGSPSLQPAPLSPSPCAGSNPRRNPSASQPSHHVLWRNVDFWGPCVLLRPSPVICMLEKYWQPSDLPYLFKALPHGNAALFYGGEVCVLFNSEGQEPRIACKINVNQLQHNQDTHSCLIRVLSFPLSFSDLYTVIRNLVILSAPQQGLLGSFMCLNFKYFHTSLTQLPV